MKTQDYIRLENEYGAMNYRPLDVVLTRGRGIWVWDVEGNKYLDFLAACSACSCSVARILGWQWPWFTAE